MLGGEWGGELGSDFGASTTAVAATPELDDPLAVSPAVPSTATPTSETEISLIPNSEASGGIGSTRLSGVILIVTGACVRPLASTSWTPIVTVASIAAWIVSGPVNEIATF